MLINIIKFHFKNRRVIKTLCKMEERFLPLMQRSCDWKFVSDPKSDSLKHKETGITFYSSDNRLYVYTEDNAAIHSKLIKKQFQILKKKLERRKEANFALSHVASLKKNLKLATWYYTYYEDNVTTEIANYLKDYECVYRRHYSSAAHIWFKNKEDKMLFDMTWK